MWRLVFWFQWFQVFEGIPACDLFFSSGWIGDNIDSILQKSSILNISLVWLLRAKLRFYPLSHPHAFNDRWKSGILPIGSWMWSVAKWIMPQSRASNPQLWHRNGCMVWPTLGCGWPTFWKMYLNQLLPLKENLFDQCRFAIAAIVFGWKENAIVSKKQM